MEKGRTLLAVVCNDDLQMDVFPLRESEMTTKSMCTFSAIRSTFKFFFRMDTHRYKLNYYINESCATCVQNYNLALLFH